ncbi:MAG TPA: hypothetical protein DCX95_00430 [Elusimicrobia bacterium]|nr:hypothetical protein [Elusimicrobiota bacterium]
MKNNNKGIGLVELMLVVAMVTGITIGIFAMLQYGVIASVKAREQMSAGRLAQMIFSKIKSVDFYFLFNCDSALSNYGLSGTYGPVTSQSATYPYLAILNSITSTIRIYGFDRWTVENTFMRRDSSDVNGNGLTSDLINFIDANSDLKDDYLASVLYYDKNSDGDYYDSYVSTVTGRKIAEQPDTHLKYVTLKLYKKGEILHQESQLISYELYTGIESQSSDAALKLFVTQPANATYLYNLNTTERQNAFNLAITKSYPENVIAYRADTVYSIRLWGETDPNALVHFYLNTPVTELDSITASIGGEFDFQSSAVTNALTEGENTILAMATRDNMYSPYAPRDVILDLNPPTISSQAPSGTVYDKMPWVGCYLYDTFLTTGTPSGICQDVICMKINDAEVPHHYDSSTGELYWDYSAELSSGITYSVKIEAGDNAYYKVMSSWTFTVDIQDPDHSAPAVSEKSPSGTCGEPLPTIMCKVQDNQSGINPSSIICKVDSTIVSHTYNSGTNFVSWSPTSAFDNGTYHTVEITVSHWAEPPKTTVESWGFNVSY